MFSTVFPSADASVQDPSLQKQAHALLVAYDGTLFAGFQRQPDQPSIQAELEQALSTILRTSIRIHPSGRTDAGVHATGQIVHFAVPHSIAVPEERRLCHSLNALLPKAITVSQAGPVPPDFHARFSCLAREYEYLIWNDPARRAHAPGSFLWVREPLDLDFLRKEARALLGENDFTSFTRPLGDEETPMRYIDRVRIRRLRDPLSAKQAVVSISIRANAFLHNMIRILVGSLLDRHEGRLRLSMRELLQCRDRTKAGKTAPAQGLYFRRAYYLQAPDLPGWMPQLAGYPWMRRQKIAVTRDA